MSHNSYRKYKKEIIAHAPYLVNRPKGMVKHCMTRIDRARHADKTGIIAKGEVPVCFYKEIAKREGGGART